MGVAGTVYVRRTRPAHAPTENMVGGYMKGGKEKREKVRANNGGRKSTAAAHLTSLFSGCLGGNALSSTRAPVSSGPPRVLCSVGA
jgi:hypothetical protein